MSGPTTVIVTADPVVTLLAASAIRAAQAIAAAHAEAADRRAENEAEREEERAAQRAAARSGREAQAAAIAAAEARFERLNAAAARLGLGAQVAAARPLPPQSADLAAWAAYARGLEMLAADLESALLTEAARRQADLGLEPEGIAVPAAAAPPLPSARLLARIAHLGPPPADIDALARELDASPPGERAGLLEKELRLRLQRHLEEVQQGQLREATALVVEQSLKDLGYQVEAVPETLFVAGGTLHFRRAGWGDYMVRMRVDAQAGSANFNVLRAVDAGDNEASVLDHIAEDRWCAEFPALLKALEAHGVRLDITRRLEAGELPVQRVARDRLPRFADDDSGRRAAQPLARELQ